ncbi:MAG: hypothetical protein F7C32_00835 [Desulfurococcales archaeon]|nr:hypothetical protein [Desulfurococcales archaeon]
MPRFIVELSRSKTGKHAIRRALFIVSEDGRVKLFDSKGTPVKPTYVKGSATLVNVKNTLKKGEFLVYVVMIKNLRGHLKGFFEVYDWEGRIVYRAKYHRLKLRKSLGNPYYAWIVRVVAEALKLKIKNFNP